MYNNKKKSLLDSSFVPRAGLEPARPQWSRDFKSRVSTNSTTKAYCFIDSDSVMNLNERILLPIDKTIASIKFGAKILLFLNEKSFGEIFF